MDKKNTMLLTVIAVATLLVAVVGATFAYFTATATDDTKTTVVTGTTETVAAIAVTTPVEALKLNLAASDMAQDAQSYGRYYAVATTETAGYSKDAAKSHIISTATVGEGGSATAHYNCTSTVKVTLDGTMATKLAEGDAFVTFGGQLASAGTVDLTKLAASYPVSYDLNGTSPTSLDITADVYIVNREDAEQNNLKASELTVTFSNDDFKCTVVK